jgi:flagellar hook-associated protein 3 FlgL
MLACDDTAIGLADNAVEDDRKNISNIRGKVGSIMQAAEARKFHMQDNILATETLRSDIRDIDFTEAITRYQNLYTALQGNLMTGGQLTSISLLDFLE